MSDLPADESLTNHVPVLYRQKGDPKTWRKSIDVWPYRQVNLQVNPWPVMFQTPVLYRQKGDPKTWQKSMDVWPTCRWIPMTSHVPVLYRQKGDPKTWQKSMDVLPTCRWIMFQYCICRREIPKPDRRVWMSYLPAGESCFSTVYVEGRSQNLTYNYKMDV